MKDLNIAEVVESTAAMLRDLPRGMAWDSVCMESEIEGYVDGGHDAETVAPILHTALYALTLSDSRFDNWRTEFRNEFH